MVCWTTGSTDKRLVAAWPNATGSGVNSWATTVAPDGANAFAPPSKWRTIASVDSHRSGMIVYKEKNSYGFDTSEVHA